MSEQPVASQSPKAPETMEELSAHLEGRIKEVQDTYAIMHMASADLIKQASSLNSARKLKKFIEQVITRNLTLHKQVSQYALEALTIANKNIKIVMSHDPRELEVQEVTANTEESISED